VLVLNALVRKSSDLLEFNQKHNAAIFSSKCETFALGYRQARSQVGHSGAVLPNYIVPRKIYFKRIVKTKILSL